MSGQIKAKEQSSKSIIKWLFAHLLPYKFKVILALVALLIGAISWLILGQGVKVVVDQGFVAGDENMLTMALIIVLAIALIGSLATYFRFYLMVWLGERVCADIRTSLFSHLVTLSPNFFAETRTGEVISRFTSDTTLLQSVVGTGVSMSLRSAVMLLGALVLMLITSWQLTLYVFIAVPLILLPIKALGRQVRHYAKQSQDDVANMGTLIDESLHEIHTLQSYNHEQASVNSFNQSIDRVMQSASQRIHYRALLISLIMFISLSSIFVVGWIGAREVIAGNISAGELTAFVFYAVLAGGSIATISEVIGDLQKAVGASERIVELLNTKPDIVDSPTAHQNHIEIEKGLHLRDSAPILQAQNICFAYPSAADKQVIKQLSFTAQRGEKVAIVGHSGAGKSTLFDLLMRFYDVSEGHIKLAGIAQQDLKLETLRKQFALVPQDAVIFALSVSDNIRLSKPDASQAEIETAAKLAYADEFIQQFSKGYHTELGERGVKLSGGQKQRIAIARAILAKRPILLLDEATSALDASSERYVKLALDSLMQETTTLIIAHRLSTVLNADKILVMQQGELIASGTHEALLLTNKVYKEFVDLQLS